MVRLGIVDRSRDMEVKACIDCASTGQREIACFVIVDGIAKRVISFVPCPTCLGIGTLQTRVDALQNAVDALGEIE